MVSILANKQAAIHDLCQRHKLKRLEVFGSAAEQTSFGPEQSDVDLVVDFLSDKGLGPWLKHFFEFRTDLEVIFDRHADLVLYSSLKNPHLGREGQRTRQLIYEPEEL